MAASFVHSDKISASICDNLLSLLKEDRVPLSQLIIELLRKCMWLVLQLLSKMFISLYMWHWDRFFS
jgi:hypothetical protein